MRANGVVRPKAGPLQIEPNITPLIDVLLVLLIIFMAALPLTQKGLDVSTPTPAPKTETPSPSIVLEYSADGRVAINHQAVDLSQLPSTLGEVFHDRRDKTLFISADGTLRYGQVISVIDAAKAAGVARIGVITGSTRVAK